MFNSQKWQVLLPLLMLPLFMLAFLAWLAGDSDHGPNPSFGFLFGTLIPIYALRPTE